MSHSQYVGLMKPLVGGDLVAVRTRPTENGGDFTCETWARNGQHRICVTRGEFGYVIDCADQPREAVEALGDVLPEPHAGNTHATLSMVVPRDGWSPQDAIVRVVAGDHLGFLGRPGDPTFVAERPVSQAFYRLSEFGRGAPVRTYAHDLRFIGKVFDDGFGADKQAAERAGGIRSLWIEDASEEMSTNRSLFKLLRCEAGDSELLPEDMMVDDDETFEELRDNPIHDPRGAILRIDVSPAPAVNFDYVTQADPEVRARMREVHRAAAIEDLLSRPTISFLDDGLSAFARFLRSKGEYRTAWDGLPRQYAPPAGVPSEHVLVFAENELGDGLPIWQEIYVNSENATASRFHVPTSQGIKIVGSSDVAAAVLYLDAQIVRDRRVSQDPVSSFDYDALASNGAYHGWGWTSFSFPDEGAFHIRIRTVKGGFQSEFGRDYVFASLEEALRASYADLTRPLRQVETEASPSP